MDLRLFMLTLFVVMSSFSVMMRGRLVLGCRSVMVGDCRVLHGRGRWHENDSFKRTSNI
jgi:hypothetical protein